MFIGQLCVTLFRRLLEGADRGILLLVQGLLIVSQGTWQPAASPWSGIVGNLTGQMPVAG